MLSTVKIIPDSNCEFWLDGEYQGVLIANEIFKIELRKGRYAFEFTSQQNKNDKLAIDYYMQENDIEDLIRIDLITIQKNRIIKEQEIVRRAKSCHIRKVSCDPVKGVCYKKTYRYEIFDSDTQETIELDPTFYSVNEFCCGLALVSKFYGAGLPIDNIEYGYINTYGEIVIPLKYNDAGDFHEGLAWVSDNAIYHEYKYINKKGETIIDINHPSQPSDFVNGLAKIICDDSISFCGGECSTEWDVVINKYGNRIVDHIAIPLKYDWFISELLEPSLNEGDYTTCWLIDTNKFQRNLLLVRSDDKYGYINRSTQEVIPLQYSKATSFDENGLAAACLDKWGIIDINGNNIVPHKYDYISKFRNGLAVCYIIDDKIKIKKWGVLCMSGIEAVPCEYENASQALQMLTAEYLK